MTSELGMTHVMACLVHVPPHRSSSEDPRRDMIVFVVYSTVSKF
jgi:hypothetical protein